jgi:hypothetical protein
LDKTVQLCEEVHAFANMAERTGVQLELASVRARKYSCRTLRDFLRKYRLYGDGFYYVRAGQWPEGQEQLDLDHVKWVSASASDLPATIGMDGS